MKRIPLLLTALFALLAAGGIGTWLFLRGPATPAEAFQKAARNETRLDEKIQLERRSASPSAENLSRHEASIRRGWSSLIERWPDSPEAANAAHRLLLRDLAAAKDGKERIDLISNFLAAHPGHEKKKDLLWQKAEILRDETKDPLAAVVVFDQIESDFAKDPVAPKAALAKAKVYEQINEYSAAAKAYRELTEKYPDAEEAAEAQMKLAGLLEERLGKKEEAAKVYQKVVEKSPGSAAGKVAERRRQNLLGELRQGDREQYYAENYGGPILNPYEISKEELGSPSLQRIRDQGFDLARYEITVRLDPEHMKLEAEAILIGRLTKPISAPLLLQLNPAFEVSQVHPILADAAELKFEQRGPFVEALLPPELSGVGTPLAFSVKYAGTIGTWYGDAMTSEGTSLRSTAKWYPQTAYGDLFTQRTIIECPSGYRAIAQGQEEKLTGAPPREGWTRFAFEQRQQTQFMTLALGKYETVAFEAPGGLPVELNLRHEHAGEAESLRKATLDILKVDLDLFGGFPFEKLTIAEAPELPGACAAPSLVLIGSGILGKAVPTRNLLAHEIARQWWGGSLSIAMTPESIPWLLEGFATYADALLAERTENPEALTARIHTLAALYRKSITSVEDLPLGQALASGPSFRPVVGEKGAALVHSLRREMGDEAFFKFLKQVFESDPCRVIQTKELALIASRAARRDLTWFFDQALAQTGFPRLEIGEASAAREGTGWLLDLKLKQPEPGWKMTLDVAIETEKGMLTREGLAVEARAENELKIHLDSKPARIELDPKRWHPIDPSEELTRRDVTIAP